jgi:hypothetical protein
MKHFLLSLACAVGLGSQASELTNPTFLKLKEVNSYWASQKDINAAALPEIQPQNERAWIKTHLQLVEQILRKRTVSHLTVSQAANRAAALDKLNGYWQEGAFPINESYSYRTPIFIDKHDNFCAVGYLVKATGFEAVSRKIALKANLAYVHDMNYPGLDKWAAAYGFTKEELAWIQPGYPPQTTFAKVGEGANGEINILYTDEANGILYAGGSFTKVDSTLSAANIAAITESNGSYTWQSLGSGVNGTVNAICTFDNKIWAGGSFTEAGGTAAAYIAYWNGASWHAAGNLMGTVKDMVVYKNQLYAINDCNTCFTAASYLVKWNGTAWDDVHYENGNFNKLFVYEGTLLIGGKFAAGTSCQQNVLQYDGDTVLPAGNCMKNEVYSFAVYSDTLLAGVKFYENGDSAVVKYLDGNTWKTYIRAASDVEPGISGAAVKALLAKNNVLCMGGEFHTSGIAMTWTNNFLANDTAAGGDENLGDFDAPVNSFALFRNKLFVAGRFVRSGPVSKVNRICAKSTLPGLETPAGIEDLPASFITVAPNPVASGASFSIASNMPLNKVQLWDISGRLAGQWGKQEDIYHLPGIAPGLYVVHATTDKGAVMKSKVIVQ